MVSEDLLEILRCPACVSDPSRREKEEDPGLLELVRDTWLVCQSPGCGRKYPIKDDIPVMLIDEGDKWVDVPVDELPEPELEPAPEGVPETTPEDVAETAPSPPIVETPSAARPMAGVLFVLALCVLVFFLWRRDKRGAQ